MVERDCDSGLCHDPRKDRKKEQIMGTSPKPQPPQVPTGEALNQMRATLGRLDATRFQAQAKSLDAQLATITTEATKLTEVESGVFVAAINSFSQVVPGVTSGVLLAVEGFDDGDTLGGVQGLMDACASLVPLIGTAVGAGIGAWAAYHKQGRSWGIWSAH
jgi:hypothetical protein